MEQVNWVESALADPGTLVLEDLESGFGGYAQGPIRGLMSALLFDGVQAFINFASARSTRQRLKYKEAYRWVTRKGSAYIFSFDSVCEGLGIDPEFLRYGLINAAKSNGESCKRTRRNF